MRAKLVLFFSLLSFTVELNAAPCHQAAPALQPQIVGPHFAGLSSPTFFQINDQGAVIYDTQGTASAMTVGYAEVLPASSATAPSGYLIFSLTQNGVLVSETTVPGVRPSSSGRLYAEVSGTLNTGVAMVNPSSTPATVSFYFTDQNGNNFGNGSFTLGANAQISAFLNQTPFNGPGSFQGTFTYSATASVAAIALHGLTNQRGEFLMTTLPVADLTASTSTNTVFFPQYADGGGWTTEVALVNPTNTTISGSIQFLGSGAAATSYTIAAQSSFSLTTSGAGAAPTTGAVQVTPSAGNVAPSGVAIFSYNNAGITVSQAGVPALSPAQTFRMFEYECGDYAGQIQTGIAIANPSTTQTATVVLTLTDLTGAPTGMTATLTIAPQGHYASFMKQIPGFQNIPYPFHGVCRISTTASSGVAVVALRGTYNERNDFLVTTATVSNESILPTATPLYFPQLVDGAGYQTEFIMYSGALGQSASGSLIFYSQTGLVLN